MNQSVSNMLFVHKIMLKFAKIAKIQILLSQMYEIIFGYDQFASVTEMLFDLGWLVGWFVRSFVL